MKRSIFFIVLVCWLAGPALASTSDTALHLLMLGNQKHALEQSFGAAPTAAVVVDPSVLLAPSTLFGISEPGLVTIDPKDSALAAKIAVPLVIVLGTDQEAVWDLYAKILKQAPDLIHALIKGQSSMYGAVVHAENNAVEILGVHPDLLVIAGQYILGKSTAQEDSEQAQEAEADAMDATSDQDQADQEAGLGDLAVEQIENNIDAQSSGGGLGFFGILLFIVALIGTIMYMDKTILKS